MYLYVTWDKNKPYGCKAFGFKSKRIPSAEVEAASGGRCLKYHPKSKKT